MLKPGWLSTWIVAGVALSDLLPTGTGMPAMDTEISLRTMLDVLLMAPVVGSIVPVVLPLLMNSVVAVTGTIPSSLNDPVAFGSDSVAVNVPAARLTFEASVPGPRARLKFAALMRVLPVTG